ncbi:MAG: hypothetical protein IJD45_06910 [Clostridia bacterium]|nr:hypothetical protein [Clostridia bacterium]
MASAASRGFVTIATGNNWYYKIALNLLNSYRYTTKKPLPFAIIADRENEITREFDKVVIINNATNSYNDKLRLGEFLPFEENIFIDADCLAYGDLNVAFQVFEDKDDFCCLGSTSPLTEKSGSWFSLLTFPLQSPQNNNIITREIAQKNIKYTVGLHGGMYYIRNTATAQKVFQDALTYAKDFTNYNFHMFNKPADEPVLALAMAINNCKPISFENFALFCFWQNPFIKMKLSKKKASCNNKEVTLLHWGSGATKTAVYKKQVDQLYMKINNINSLKSFYINTINTLLCYPYYFKLFLIRIKQRIKKPKLDIIL